MYSTRSLELSGPITGPGGLTKAGFGTLYLQSPTNTYTGPTAFSAASQLIVNSYQPQSPVTVGAACTLGGYGTVGHITSTLGGAVAPGVSPGILTCSNVAFSGVGSVFNVELNGTSPGAGHDQLNARGTISLGGSTLNVSVGAGFMPVEGQPLVILNNDGSDAITGTFNLFRQGRC